jgi:hypothetical protein
MPGFLRQSTASQSRAIGPFVDDTDFKTAETGLTIANTDIKLMANGAASANKNSGGGTHRVNGYYGVTFDATDTATVGELAVSVVVAGALPVFDKFFVVEEAVYDALYAASAPGYVDNAPVNVAQFGGSNGTFSGGRPEVNTTHAAGTAWGSGAITAASIASDAITAAKIADGAIDAATFAAGAINAAAIASDAITDAKVASDVTIASVTGSVGSVTGAVGSVTGAVGSVTGNVGGNVTGSVGSVATGGITASSFAADAITAAKIAADVTTELQSGLATASALATLQSSVDVVDGIVDAILVDTAVIGAAGAGLTAVPWNAAWDAEVQSEVSDGLIAYGAATATDVTTAAANVSVDEIQATALADLFNTNSGTTYASAVAGSLVKEIADNAGGSALTAGAIADAVWDEALSGHLTSGSTGEALNAAGAAGDPWITSLPGSYTSGQAGKIVGDFLNASVSSRLASASYTAPLDAAGTRSAVGLASANLDTQLAAAATVGASSIRSAVGLASANLDTQLTAIDDFLDTEIAAIKAKTDNLPASPAATGDIPTALQNADALLNRDMSAVSDTNARSPLNALRFVRNKWSISGTTLTVTKENDTTTAWTATVTASPGADPISGNDPT